MTRNFGKSMYNFISYHKLFMLGGARYTIRLFTCACVRTIIYLKRVCVIHVILTLLQHTQYVFSLMLFLLLSNPRTMWVQRDDSQCASGLPRWRMHQGTLACTIHNYIAPPYMLAYGSTLGNVLHVEWHEFLLFCCTATLW